MSLSVRQQKELEEIGDNSIAAIVEMVQALEVDYDRLQELDDLAAGSAWNGTAEESEERARLRALAGDCNSREDAEQRIHEDPLCLEYRTAWIVADQWSSDSKTPGEFCLLLTTGGPAVRIIGEIDDGQADEDTIQMQIQDWGTPWTNYHAGAHADALRTYVRCFYFG